ncbi:hypothetical protein D3C71_1543690 [compost metagenome]
MFPLRVLRRHPLELGQGKQHLEIGGLFAPQGAVIVEHGDPLGGGHIILAPFRRHRGDEGLDGLARGAILPGGERIGGPCQQGQCEQQQGTPVQERQHGGMTHYDLLV